MIVRHWLGDLALAVLLALPLTAFSQPQLTIQPAMSERPAMNIASVHQSPRGRVSLFG